MSEFQYLEGRVAESLGISAATLRKGRKLFLVEGETWGLVEFEKKRRVAYTMTGLVRLVKGMQDSAEFGARASGAVQAGDLSAVMESALVRAASIEKREAVEEAPAVKLLEAPWACPEAVLVVERLTKNRRILLAKIDDLWIAEHGYGFFHSIGTDPRGLMRVRVRETKNFINGMPVECRHVQLDLWECTARMPRWKGRY